MSEEDIIFVLKDLIAYYKRCAINKQDVLLSYQGIIAIETLLKLYQEEKSNSKYLKNQIPIDKIFYYSYKDFVPKNKIKDKINEIHNYTFMSEKERNAQDYAICKLQELLGE